MHKARKGKSMTKCQYVPILAAVLMLGSIPGGWAQSVASSGLAAGVAPAGPVVDGLALSASTDKGMCVGGEAIVLKLALTNPTTSTQYLGVVGSASPLDLFDFRVTFADMGQVPLTAFGKRSLKRNPNLPSVLMSVFSFHVQPGKALHYQVVVNRLFDMTRSGTYRIIVRRYDPFATGMHNTSAKHPPLLVSNTVAVRVVDPEPDFYDSNTILRL